MTKPGMSRRWDLGGITRDASESSRLRRNMIAINTRTVGRRGDEQNSPLLLEFRWNVAVGIEF
jgi:hypothetical protein